MVFLTNLADELSELVQVALSIRSDAQLPDASVELLRSLKRILQQEQGRLQLSRTRQAWFLWTWGRDNAALLKPGALEPYLLVRLVLCFSEEADVLDEPGFDVLVVHELAEDVKLFPQELVGEVHLMDEERCAAGEPNTPAWTESDLSDLSSKLTVVFMMPVPCVRMELAMWRMLMVFRCLLLLAFSMKI